MVSSVYSKVALRALMGMCLLWLVSPVAHAETVYQSPEEFLRATFPEKLPETHELWHTKELRAQIKQLIGRTPFGARTRYWQSAGRSVWVLDEIGKEEAITFGVVVEQQKISQIKVLVYRESRGWEIRSDAFTQQFAQAQLTQDNKLSKSIDGITGATLSVRAMEKMAKLALFLDAKVAAMETK